RRCGSIAAKKWGCRRIEKFCDRPVAVIGAFIVLTRCKRPFLLRMANASPCLLPFQGEQADVARRRGIGATAICASFLQNAAAVTPLSQPGASASLLHTFPGVLRAPT